ncbi:HlyD family type I secretion periplasmic adaptor subunit [Bradyrhizobium lablabi]|uniref:HlyD family type I secretion periplasmic adaptor subunit n=1 Tax=Bradyrhizobium lablabi TaxID=722472 RepID=UPI001BAA3798|nr:HlyD family type I secretion periplasmic adaptor subunit [Bradyrhizobium lablabi]MBR0694255.1 HlyD family type I secretion periplasmic adaptor subunit [Bradyrhizobium lablabi]
MDAQAGKDKDTVLSMAQEQRPAEQIGGDVEYSKVTRGVRMLLIGVVGLVAVLVGLSIIIPVEEVARARGEFVPLGRMQVIQAPEGGALEAVSVQNDQRVTKGQLIAKFRAEDLLRDLARSEVRMAYLAVQIERLDAFALNRPAVFDQYQAKYPGMVKEAVSLGEQQQRELTHNLEEKDKQIEAEKSALDAANREIPSAKTSQDATQELLQRMRQGVDMGVIPANRLAQAQEQAAESERVHTQLVASLDQHSAKIKGLEAQRQAVLAKSAADARNQRSELMVQLDELKATQAAYQSRSADIEVRAPVDGVVQKISETPIGTVIPPGGTVCEIVPAGGVLIQARVSPRDIGFVRLGQAAIVKSDAFDYSRFGSIPGKVVRIAPSSTVGGPGQAPYFQVEIELDRPHVGADVAHVVTPGMTGEATILTGQKTIFQYLLKPIYTTMDTAMRER